MMHANFDTLREVIVCGKVVAVRADLNLPIAEDGSVMDFFRLRSIMPTMQHLMSEGAKILLISHFGRPKGLDLKLSLGNLRETLERFFGTKVHFVNKIEELQIKNTVESMNFGEVALLENLRFYDGEKKNDVHFAETIGSFANVYVNEAFSCSHRNHASMCAITNFARSVAGFCLEKEISVLDGVLSLRYGNIGCALLGGAKVSDKIEVLEFLVKKLKFVFLGGAMANTFLKSLGVEVGKSLVEDNMLQQVTKIISDSVASGCSIILPVDVVVEDANGLILEKAIEEVSVHDKIYDVGARTLERIVQVVQDADFAIMNGPFGFYEKAPFHKGTVSIVDVVGKKTKEGGFYSVAGGGDIVSCVNDARRAQDFSFLSTGGGAFLEYIAGKSMPGIEALTKAKEGWKGSSF